MKTLIVIILVLSFATATAQEHFLGIKGGINIASVSTTNYPSPDNTRTGLIAGITYERFLNKKFGVSADLIYNQRGFSENIYFRDANNQLTGAGEVQVHYDYLSLPVKAGLRFGKNLYGFSNIGIVPSYLVNAKVFVPVADQYGHPTGAIYITNLTNASKFDLAGMIEAGAGYKLKQFLLFTSAAYQYSLTSITNSDFLSGSKINSYGLSFTAGIKYNLTK